MEIGPGQCVSACIYPYLGGDYRYLVEGSAIGIHQFRFIGDLGTSAATILSQELSGKIVDIFANPALTQAFLRL